MAYRRFAGPEVCGELGISPSKAHGLSFIESSHALHSDCTVSGDLVVGTFGGVGGRVVE